MIGLIRECKTVDLQRQIELAAQSKIKTLDVEIRGKQSERDRLVAELQCTCSHPEIVECSYASGPPARVCTTCGLAEWGWHCGHKVLQLESGEYSNQLRTVSPSEFHEMRRGKTHSNGFFVCRGRKPADILRDLLLGPKLALGCWVAVGEVEAVVVSHVQDCGDVELRYRARRRSDGAIGWQLEESQFGLCTFLRGPDEQSAKVLRMCKGEGSFVVG